MEISAYLYTWSAQVLKNQIVVALTLSEPEYNLLRTYAWL